MAAIIGVADATGQVERLLACMRHRGPDGCGTARTDGGALGMTRLRVRPPSQLPLPPEVGARPVGYNGEVYAGGPGDGAVTTVDDELAALFGDRATIDGMWAAVWPQGPGLVLERDPWGQRPLYYRRVGTGWAAASEASSLLRVFGASPVSEDALVEMLALGAPVTATTVYRDVHAVPPAARVTLVPGRPSATSTVDQLQETVEGLPAPPLGEALDGAVRRCAVADRQLGLALSGGLDSGLLADGMLRLELPEVVTLSVLVSPGEADDVRNVTGALEERARKLGWRHESTTVGKERYLDLLTEAVGAMGLPTRMSSVPLYLALGHLARSSGVVVMLTGEGADELFCGYDSYRRYLDGAPGSMVDRLERVHLPARRRRLLELLFGDRQVARCREAYRDLAARARDADGSPLRRLERALSLTPLLERADVCLMARSVEGRAPFLHGGIPAHARALEDGDLLAGGVGKLPLRRLARQRLDLPLWSDAKRPFRAPLRTWLNDGDRAWNATVRARAQAAGRKLDLCARGVDGLLGEAGADDEAAGLVGALLAVDACEFIP